MLWCCHHDDLSFIYVIMQSLGRKKMRIVIDGSSKKKELKVYYLNIKFSIIRLYSEMLLLHSTCFFSSQSKILQEISTECCCCTTYVEETILLSPGGQNPHRFTEHSAQGLVHTITYSYKSGPFHILLTILDDFEYDISSST